MSSADIYRLPAQREPKARPRDLGFLTIVSIAKEGEEYAVQFTGKNKLPVLHSLVSFDIAASLRVGMRVRLIVEEDLA